jgi:sugar lactone lactonase YvrE
MMASLRRKINDWAGIAASAGSAFSPWIEVRFHRAPALSAALPRRSGGQCGPAIVAAQSIRGNSMTIKTARRLAFLLLFGVACSISLMIWAGSQKNRIVGPAALAEDSHGHIWMIANSALHLLEADGELISSWSGAQLGISGALTALSRYDDGRVLLGSRDEGKIHIVNELGLSSLLVDPAQTSSGAFFDVFALAYDSRSRTIFASDTNGHRMLSFDHEGRPLGVAGGDADRKFHFPNVVGLDPTGQLYVANTNNHRIDFVNADLSIGDVLAGYDGASMSCCSWPVAASIAPGGQRYASWLTGGMNQGSVYKFGDDGQPLFEVKLPNPGSWVVALLARDKDVLAADGAVDGFTVHRFGHDGRYLGAFGDATLLHMLADSQRRLGEYQRLRSFGTLLAILCCAGLLAAARRLQRAEVEQAAERNPLPARRQDAVAPAFAKLIGLTLAFAVALALANAVLQRCMRLALPDATPLQSLGLAMLSFVLLIMALVLAQRWTLRSSFLHAINRTRAEHFLRAWAPQLNTLLAAGEAVVGASLVVAMSSPGRRYRLTNGLLVWTGQRLLILAVLPGLRRTPLWAQWLADIDAPGVSRLRRGWLYWLQGSVEQIDLKLRDGRTSLILANPIDSPAVAADISGRAAARIADPDTPPSAAGQAGAVQTGVIDLQTRRSALLLSLLLPGLGHFRQRRILPGSYLLLFGLLSAGQAFLALHAWGFHTMAVSPASLRASVGVAAAIWLIAFLDVYRYDRPPPVAGG